jgi:hypothetical protein
MSSLFLIHCPSLCCFEVLLATSFVKFTDDPSIRPYFFEEIKACLDIVGLYRLNIHVGVDEN